MISGAPVKAQPCGEVYARAGSSTLHRHSRVSCCSLSQENELYRVDAVVPKGPVSVVPEENLDRLDPGELVWKTKSTGTGVKYRSRSSVAMGKRA